MYFTSRPIFVTNMPQIVSPLCQIFLCPVLRSERDSLVWYHFSRLCEHSWMRGSPWAPSVPHYNLFSNRYTGLKSLAPFWDVICGSLRLQSPRLISVLDLLMFFIRRRPSSSRSESEDIPVVDESGSLQRCSTSSSQLYLSAEAWTAWRESSRIN